MRGRAIPTAERRTKRRAARLAQGIARRLKFVDERDSGGRGLVHCLYGNRPEGEIEAHQSATRTDHYRGHHRTRVGILRDDMLTHAHARELQAHATHGQSKGGWVIIQGETE
jgi:hypothetical protein